MFAKVHVRNYHRQPVFKMLPVIEATVDGLFEGRPALFTKRPDGRWWMLSRETPDGWRSINVGVTNEENRRLNAIAEAAKYPFGNFGK